jgi:hypothetical protein
MRIIIQFLAQAVGVIAWHMRSREPRPWRMPLYPLPALVSMGIWLAIFFSSKTSFILFASSIICIGILLYLLIPFRKPAGED